jgi:PAS domain-containing protein
VSRGHVIGSRPRRCRRIIAVVHGRRPDTPRLVDGSSRRPAGIATGPGHVVVYGNPAFRSMFGAAAIGLPARESLIGLPAAAFGLLDAVLSEGRPLARWIDRDDGRWRLTAIPRRDPENGDVFGVAFHLRAGSDLPIASADEAG